MIDQPFKTVFLFVGAIAVLYAVAAAVRFATTPSPERYTISATDRSAWIADQETGNIRFCTPAQCIPVLDQLP